MKCFNYIGIVQSFVFESFHDMRMVSTNNRY